MEDVLEIGSVPCVNLPKFQTQAHITTDYSSTRSRFLSEYDATRDTHKVPVSEDGNAEHLAAAPADSLRQMARAGLLAAVTLTECHRTAYLLEVLRRMRV
jgi:hypothetical protein